MRRWLLVLVCVCCAVPAQAAVSHDCNFEKGTASPASPFSYASASGTVSCTVPANSNRVLMCAVGSFVTYTPTGLTWNSVSMTHITSAAVSGAGQVDIYGLINNASGSQTISLTFTGSPADLSIGCVAFSSADQTTGWQNTGTDTGTSTSASSTVTSANGNAVFVGHANNNATSTTISSGTAAWTDTALNGNYAGGWKASTTSSTVVTWTLGSSVGWANVKADVIAFTSGGTHGLFRLNPLSGLGTGGPFFSDPLAMIGLALATVTMAVGCALCIGKATTAYEAVRSTVSRISIARQYRGDTALAALMQQEQEQAKNREAVKVLRGG